MHAERDIVLSVLSVCLSVCPMPVLRQNEWTCHSPLHRGLGASSIHFGQL